LAGFRISISRGKENVSPRQTAGAAHRALASAAETEHRQNDAGQGFPVRRRGFCAVFDKQKILQPQRLQDFLELLPGFGPGTSSLPILLHCVFAHVSFCSLSQFTQCFQCIERLANIYLL